MTKDGKVSGVRMKVHGAKSRVQRDRSRWQMFASGYIRVKEFKEKNLNDE